METVPSPSRSRPGPKRRARSSRWSPQNIAFGIIAAAMVARRDRGRAPRRTSCTPRSISWSCSQGRRAVHPARPAEFVAVTQVLVYIGAIIVLFLFGIMLTRARSARRDLDNDQRGRPPSSRSFLVGVLGSLLVDAFHGDKLELQLGRSAPTQVSDSIFSTYLVPVRGRRRAAARPRSSAPSSWPGGTEPCCSTSSCCSPRSCSAPASTACSPASNGVLVLMSIELILNARQHQPGRVRRVAQRQRDRAGLRAVRHRRSPPPRSASASPSSCSSTATSKRRSRRGRRDEGLSRSMLVLRPRLAHPAHPAPSRSS